MRLKHTYILLSLLFSLVNKAQVNLVPNPSFETLSKPCQLNLGVSYLGSSLSDWLTLKYMSVDCYNTCANSYTSVVNPYPFFSNIPQNCYGYQQPHTGDAYVGIGLYVLNYLPDSTLIDHEQAVVKLNHALRQGHCYYGEFYFSLSNINAITINRLGMLLSTTANTLQPYMFDNTVQPQIQWDTTQFFTDTLNWVKVSGKFIANGGEEYLSIGNFRDGAHLKKKFINTAFVTPCGIMNPHAGCYVYIDDVSLFEIPKPNLGADIKTCGRQDSVVIGDVTLNNNGTNVRWLLREPQQPNTMQLSVTSNTIKVSAAKTATYVMEYEGCTADTIVINYTQKCPQLSDSVLIIPNVFTPNNDGANDVWQFVLPNNVTLSGVEVYNRWGNLIHSVASRASATVVRWDGRTTSGEPCSEGVYFYTLTYLDANGDEQKHFGYISLIK